MIHARLREVRKRKGLTLQQVAERVPPDGTTPQTIGRLETGARKLTLEWLEKIAKALEVDPAELLVVPGAGDLEIAGTVALHGRIDRSPQLAEILALRQISQDAIALRVEENLGAYRAGDVLLCRPLEPAAWQEAVGCEAYVEEEEGFCYFGKLARLDEKGRGDILAPGARAPVWRGRRLKRVAPLRAVLRLVP
ncbi:MAG: XRE family transcriptional regulator [Alphaproteobacteria bacterium]|nr:MAG: XRE family transcriptional regulator [Alphaproteobacteria bacterium]